MADEWEAVEGNKNFWNPTKDGEEIQGKLAGIEDGMYGKKYTLQIIREGKEEMLVMPSHKQLQSRLSACGLGEELKIIFKGTQPPKARNEQPMRVYEVLRKKPATEEQVK